MDTPEAGHGFRSDGHLAARFSTFTMPGWTADATLADFLATYERFLPLRKPSDLSSPDKVKALAKIGGGVIGKIVTRIQNAALAAIADGTECISKDHLIKAASRPLACMMTPGKGEK